MFVRIIATTLLTILLLPMSAYAQINPWPLITEVQTASDISANEEFVELFNPSNELLGVSGWELQYRPADGDNWITKLTLTGAIEPHGHYLIANNDYLTDIASEHIASGLAADGGHIRLVQSDDELNDEVIYDKLGWGTAIDPETTSALAPEAGQSLKRFVDEDGIFIDTNNNLTDFFISDTPSPMASGQEEQNEEPEEKDYLPIEIKELFPDPASPLTDVNDEFVEIYNPNDEAVNLDGYVLQTGNSFSYSATLPEIIIEPGSYLALLSSDIGLLGPGNSLTLSNSGSTARILDPSGEIQGEAEPYVDAREGWSWSKFNDGWKWSERTTPDAVNELVISDEENTQNSTTSGELKPCRSDQFRNPETNRCKLKETSNGLTPCKSNQYRNPETNRCKSIGSGISGSLKPCNLGQYRNPETNRCKKLESSPSSLVPCDEGQERNPETNRCRNVTPTGVDATDAAAVLSSDKVGQNLPLIAVIAGGTLLYALYEFRYDFRNAFTKARGYIGARTTSGRDP